MQKKPKINKILAKQLNLLAPKPQSLCNDFLYFWPQLIWARDTVRRTVGDLVSLAAFNSNF